ncbi:maestro heat-like repeat family member 5 isoform X3 [Vicugna pacos]|uniref:Maestro heat-like repeat family member 5 isoform X3 n=1 Tax=Vicugna pacos TaxID=30538 RepID=A0ABM5CBB9_VICPA
MVAAPSDGTHRPSWWSSRLSPEEQELDIDLLGRAVAHRSLSGSPPWEEELVSKIKTLSALEKSLVLEAVRHCVQQDSQKVPEASIPNLLKPFNLDLKSPLGKTLLFHLYGLILRETASEDLVGRHLAALLELSHQSSGHREGIALAVGITSTSHLEQVWAMLEHLGRTKFLRSALVSSDSQPDPDAHWRWIGSTTLLCYGRMALHAGKHILPWVDNIASRMVYYFWCSDHDNTLKTSFLSASIMLVKALSREVSAQRYKFTQIPELIQCLLCILENEPNILVNLFRQKIILVITELSHLRPRLKPTLKSRILQTCMQSLYTLPPAEVLKTSLPPLDPVPDVVVLYQKSAQALDLLLQNFVSENESMDEICFLLQHAEPWLKSNKSHECRRVVQSIFLLLKYVLDYVRLTEEALPSMLGRQVGLLTLLWRDKDKITQSHSSQCVYLLLQLLIQQKTGNTAEFINLNKMKNFEARVRRESEMKFYNLVKALDGNLTVAQHTQLVLTLLQGLCSRDILRCNLAAELLLMIVEGWSVKPEQVAEILQGLFQELPCIIFRDVLQTMMKAVTLLGTQHTQQTVEVMLSLCHPSERHVMPLWKALAANSRLARKVVTLLYVKLKLRPHRELIRFPVQAELMSLLALGAIYELLYVREYKATVRWAFAGILLGLLTQLHYLFELDVVEGIADHQEESLETQALSPCRTCLEALKGLFWTTNYWEVFAYLKLLRGWELFERLETYTEGVALLARAMAHYNCEVKAVLGQAVIFLKSPEERDNIVAILIITEFLNGQELTQYMSRKTMDNFLSLGLNNPNQLVRAMSLKGLSSILLQPKKVVLLRNRLAVLLDSFLKPEPKDLLGLMEILGDILHRLGTQGVGAISLKMAQHLLPLFENEKEGVRGGAIFLYGDVIYSGGKKFRQALKSHAFQALVPLLFHLADSCPDVVMKTKLTFLRCAILLKWEFRKELFGKLAWGRGLGAENDILIYMVPRLLALCMEEPTDCPHPIGSDRPGPIAEAILGGAEMTSWRTPWRESQLVCKVPGPFAQAPVLTGGRRAGPAKPRLCPSPPRPCRGPASWPWTQVESNFGNYHQFLMRALVYLVSPDRHLKLVAMKFIGGLLQDYFADLCFCLKKGDVSTLRKYLELLEQDPDSESRKFYKSFFEDVVELSQYVT